MTAYTLYNNVSHYSIEDVFDGDCYFICEFEHSNFDHSNGFSNTHRASLPTVESKYPTCIGCLHAEIQELESCVERLTHLETICNTQHS